MEESLRARLTELSKVLDPRYMTLKKAKAIHEIMGKMDRFPRDILEVGTFAGTGAIMLAEMVRPRGGRVTTVDLPWTGRSNDHFSKTVDDYLAEIGVGNVDVVRLDGGGEEWLLDYFHRLKHYKTPIDLAYIDGGHKWVSTMAQFAACFAAVRVGGWIVMDDIESNEWPEVRDCWHYVVSRIVPDRLRYTKAGMGFVCRGQFR